MNHHLSGEEPSAAYRAACGNHLDNATIARRAGVGTLVLTHMPRALDALGVRDRVLEETARVFTGRVVWGTDLLTLPVPWSG